MVTKGKHPTLDEVEPLIDVKKGAPIVGVDERTLRGWLAADPVFRFGPRLVHRVEGRTALRRPRQNEPRRQIHVSSLAAL